ncbi:hypothetical protein A0H81_02168 [Grifola frondosa]|uniref:Nudix hydrolase domain-containing protein n=1 Tax=Grifola frondosa TaxID=5627 RepID=A0A1C7MNH5_GRIFR|nr:hypothetical protein A0H81_02168 [Grifola frondosa]
MIRNNMHALMMLSATALIVLSLPVAYTMLRMKKPKARPQTQYSSSQFVFSAGAIPFVLDNGVPKKVVLVHNWKKDEWLLAKGRKDQGEELSATATREVLEETGYPCRLLSVPRLPHVPPLLD